MPQGKVPWVAPKLEKAPRVHALVPEQVPELVLALVREPVPEQELGLDMGPKLSDENGKVRIHKI